MSGLDVVTTHVAPRSMEYSTDVMADPFDEPSVKGTTKVRLVEVFGVKITGGFGTRVVTAVRDAPERDPDIAELGFTEVAMSAMNTVAILIRFTKSAKSREVRAQTACLHT
jgi:hypothetical protein